MERLALYFGIALGLQGLLFAAPVHAQSTSPSWSFEANQAGAHLGSSVSSAGDVNGDGYDDVLVGAPDAANGEDGEGIALLFLGSPNGPSLTPAWSQEGDQSGAHFGFSVATAGDVNGDNYSDVLIGAPGYDGGHTDEGAAFLYLGSPGGLSSTPVRSWLGNQAGAGFGSSVGTAGDVNSDGFDDVLVGAPGFDGGESDEGAALLFLGAAAGPPSTHAWSAEGNQAGASLGSSVAALGDMNGDGFGDVGIGAPLFDGGQIDEGQVRVFGGASLGLGASPLQSTESNSVGSRFGTAVSCADFLGNGVRWILYGAPVYTYTNPGEGGTFLAGLGQPPFFLDFGHQDFARRGISIASAGDVNADGRMDVVIGADRYDNGEEDEGLVTVYLGHPDFVVNRSPAWALDVDQAFSAFGASVASAGDVNGDGYDDIIAGAPLYDRGQTDEGRAFVYLGPSGVLTAVDVTSRTPGSPSIRQVGSNPFRSSLKLAYSIPRGGYVHLSVVDVHGRQRALLANEVRGPGSHAATWDGRDRSGADCAAGIYFVRLAYDGSTTVHRALRIK